MNCADLPKGDITQIQQAQKKVFLIRGFQDWYSTGIDQLAEELQARQISVETFRESQWHDLENQLVNHPVSPIVLVGFSYGADDVISISRSLHDRNIPVDLLITIDPVTPGDVPSNVKDCKNFYEPDGFWDVFPWLRGIPLQRDNKATANLQNINIRERDDLNEPDTRHSTIAANEKVHAAIIQLIADSLAKH